MDSKAVAALKPGYGTVVIQEHTMPLSPCRTPDEAMASMAVKIWVLEELAEQRRGELERISSVGQGWLHDARQLRHAAQTAMNALYMAISGWESMSEGAVHWMMAGKYEARLNLSVEM